MRRMRLNKDFVRRIAFLRKSAKNACVRRIFVILSVVKEL